MLDAAIHEFAVYGYHAARTTAIAERVGVSQPYLYALFSDKKTLFLACQDQVRERIRAAFFEAARPSPHDPSATRAELATETDEERALCRLAARWRALLPDQDLMRCQLQGFAAAADPEIREKVRRGVMESIDTIVDLTGAGRDRVATFVARGVLLSIGSVLGLPPEYLPATPTYNGQAAQR